MSKRKFRQSRIMPILMEGEAGLPAAEVHRKHGISAATCDASKSNSAGAALNRAAAAGLELFEVD